jgi:hypothetical protein
MTAVLIVIIVLAVLVLGAILTKVGWAIRSAPDRLRASRPYRRPRNRT